MPLTQPQQQFKDACLQDSLYKSSWRTSDLLGFSNRAQVVDGGLYVGYSNLERINPNGYLLICCIKFPPEDTVFFGIYIGAGTADFNQRLENMAARGQRNNLTKIYLRDDGRLYLHNDYLDDLTVKGGFNPDNASPSVDIDKVVYAVYPPSVSAKRSLLAREFVGYLARFVGRNKVHEAQPWTITGSISAMMRRQPHTIKLADIESAIQGLGGHYVDDLVVRFHIALNHLPEKHFVILTGLSGTGKTSLATRYACAVHGITDETQADPLFFTCPVRPDWTDPTELVGYYDVIANRYVVPRFLEALLVATMYPDAPVFVLLDEMNLARVEYYLSDVLSAMESRRPSLHLHSSSIPYEGSTGGEILSDIPFPPNVYLIGTINIDETTHPVSDKVLDRATVIDMSTVDLDGYLDKLRIEDLSLTASIDVCRPILVAVLSRLAPEGLGFGYRTALEFVRYHAFAATLGTMTDNDIIDHQMAQKVLVKLRGTERQRAMLKSLVGLFATYTKSLGIVRHLQEELEELGAFQASR